MKNYIKAVETMMTLLDDPATAELSNRELGRRCGVDHHFAAATRAIRAVLAAGRWGPHSDGPSAGSAMGTTPAASAPVLRSAPGHTPAFEPPALNSLHCWQLASPDERTRFVDAVGLNALYDAAPPDHRDAFLAKKWSAARRVGLRLPPLATGVQRYVDQLDKRSPGEMPDVPAFLDRRAKRAAREAA